MDIIKLIESSPSIKKHHGLHYKDRLDEFKLIVLNKLTLDEKLLLLKPSLQNKALSEIINHPAYLGMQWFFFLYPKFDLYYYLYTKDWNDGLQTYLIFINSKIEYEFKIEHKANTWKVTSYTKNDNSNHYIRIFEAKLDLPAYSSLNDAVESIKVLFKLSEAKRMNSNRYNVTQDLKYSPHSLKNICCFFVGHLLYSQKLVLESLLPKKLFDLVEKNSFTSYKHQWLY
jgi:hypothetical protein